MINCELLQESNQILTYRYQHNQEHQMSYNIFQSDFYSIYQGNLQEELMVFFLTGFKVIFRGQEIVDLVELCYTFKAFYSLKYLHVFSEC